MNGPCRFLMPTAAAVLLAVAATSASAISIPGGCDVNDVTSDVQGAATACYGLVAGNIETSGKKGYEALIPDSAFGGAFGGDNWNVAPIELDLSTHEWSGNLSGFDELVIVLKQSTLWGAWYFDDASDFGSWSTAWDYPNGNDGQGGGISHWFALTRGRTEVPEPGTLALFGLGLMGVGLARRRRS